MSLYELLSTTAALNLLDTAPAVDEADWESSMNLIQELAKFDPTLKV